MATRLKKNKGPSAKPIAKPKPSAKAKGSAKAKASTQMKSSPKARVLPLVPTPSRGEQALYLYGVSPPTSKNASLKMLGVDGQHGVEGIACGGFLCWVTPVDAHEFAAELARKMEELEWLAESSVRHQRIVSAIAERMTMLPARFGTIFLS